MKVTLNWLKQYVDFDWSPEQLAERLTMLGLEVEGVHNVAGRFDGIVVAQILSKEKVPGSDKLSACRVNDGKGERTIICGAQNHNVGDKVPLILPNYALPLKPGEKEPFVIKERKVFGILSQGMMCSPQELGLPDPVDGLLLLPADAKVGKLFAEHLGLPGGDVVFDLEVTPNRPDWNSLIGIAREIAALTGNPLKIPDVNLAESADTKAESLVSVQLEDPELCPRYTARVVLGVKIGPSPDWMRSILERVGVRSISNVVDATNYVMLECGQPLHAFDYHLLSPAPDGQPGKSPAIIVRRAAAAESFTTLDGVRRALTHEMLLIADETKGIALAGIMGGQNTEINDRTVDVLIESAYFKPTNIRRTSKTLNLRSESSYRFERGTDIGGCDWASRRVAQLILQTAGGRLASGAVDAYPKPADPAQISLRHAKVGELLGIDLRPEEIEFYLGQLGLKTTAHRPRPVGDEARRSEQVTFRIPTYRVDLKREVDLIEEVARLHGVDRIPAASPRGAVGANSYDSIHDQLAEARRILTGLGLQEVQGQTLISKSECRGGGTAPALTNPLSSDMDVLRPSLLPGLLSILRHNVSRKNEDLALFEAGRVFIETAQAANAGGTTEGRRVALALTGRRLARFWSGADREAKFDSYDLKGVVEEFFEHFGIRGATFHGRAGESTLFIESAGIQLGRLTLGELGQLHPALARTYDLRDPVLMAELNLDEVLARRNPNHAFKALPQYPSIRRDVAMIVQESTTHEAVLAIVKQAKPNDLESVELFDVFRGKNVPAGQKSMAYAFTYRSADRTLTDAEASAAHDKLVAQFKAQLQATVRE